MTRPVFKVRGRVSSKSVMLMTIDDDPHASNPSLKRQAIKKAADLAETGINLQVLPLEAGPVNNAIIFTRGVIGQCTIIHCCLFPYFFTSKVFH